MGNRIDLGDKYLPDGVPDPGPVATGMLINQNDNLFDVHAYRVADSALSDEADESGKQELEVVASFSMGGRDLLKQAQAILGILARTARDLPDTAPCICGSGQPVASCHRRG